DPHAHIAPPCEVSMLGIIARRRAIVFAIGQIFKQGRELLTRLRAVRHVESRSQPDAVFHGNPRLLHAHSVRRRRWRLGRTSVRRKNENEAENRGGLRQSRLRGLVDISRILCEKWKVTCALTRSQSCGPCSRRMARKSIPSCSAFLYR